jgi:hypothetical protein
MLPQLLEGASKYGCVMAAPQHLTRQLASWLPGRQGPGRPCLASWVWESPVTTEPVAALKNSCK